MSCCFFILTSQNTRWCIWPVLFDISLVFVTMVPILTLRDVTVKLLPGWNIFALMPLLYHLKEIVDTQLQQQACSAVFLACSLDFLEAGTYLNALFAAGLNVQCMNLSCSSWEESFPNVCNTLSLGLKLAFPREDFC